MLDENGISADAKEATSFARFGIEVMFRRTYLIPQLAETRIPSCTGKITPGTNFRGYE